MSLGGWLTIGVGIDTGLYAAVQNPAYLAVGVGIGLVIGWALSKRPNNDGQKE
jgi:hypothetical protein